VCDGFSQRCVDLNASGCQVAGDCALEPGCANGCTCEADGTCEPIPVTGTDAGPGPGVDSGPTPVTGDEIDLSGFIIENWEHDPVIQIGILPDGVVLERGQHLVLGRDSSKTQFEAYWGVTLGDDVVYLNAETPGSGVPNINGSEHFAVKTPVGTVIHETAVATNGKNRCHHRVALGESTDGNNWAWDRSENAVPGATDLPSGGPSELLIDQFSDADDPAYEFLQFYYTP
jgi:hypothetical protein